METSQTIRLITLPETGEIMKKQLKKLKVGDFIWGVSPPEFDHSIIRYEIVSINDVSYWMRASFSGLSMCGCRIKQLDTKDGYHFSNYKDAVDRFMQLSLL